jgi:hypothetical protein
VAVDDAVTIALAGRQLGPPPLTWLQLDVRLRNDELVPRWFLLPVVLTASWTQVGDRDTVARLDAYELRGTGRIVLGRLSGARELHAVCVAAAGDVAVRGLAAMSFDEEQPDGPFPIGILAATAMTVGGRPAEELFPRGDPTSDARADVAAEPSVALGSWRAEGEPAAIELANRRTYAIELRP